jgi:hypothetical protein
LAEPQRKRSDFELLRLALERRSATAQSETYRAGLLGEAIRRTGQPALAGELNHLWIPGLAALGVEAHLTPLSRVRDWERTLHLDADTLLFGFSGSLEFAAPDEITDATPIPHDTDPEITVQARMRTGPPDTFRWQNAGGPVEQATALPDHFSHALLLRSSVGKTPRRIGISAALHRWLAWHAAYPERAPDEADTADPSGALAAAFLWETIGTRRDFVSNRLRYAAQCFETAQIEGAYRWLLEAATATWQLPIAPATALGTPPEQPLSDVLRRELIYFARAGSLPLKTLAARRLTHEAHHPDARKTLHQLAFDLHPWVRAAVRPSSR